MTGTPDRRYCASCRYEAPHDPCPEAGAPGHGTDYCYICTVCGRHSEHHAKP